MAPIVNGLEKEFAGEAAVLQLDANEAANANLLQRYGLRGHPAFAIVDRDGRLAETFIGPQSEETLRASLTATLGS
jgi:thioredoxin-like negative regulator of GroEL